MVAVAGVTGSSFDIDMGKGLGGGVGFRSSLGIFGKDYWGWVEVRMVCSENDPKKFIQFF